MKRFYKLMIFAAAMVAGMTSCSTKVIEDEPQPVNPSKETRTINVRVVSNDFTRAGEVADDEIQTLYLAFYKGNSSTPMFVKEATSTNTSYSVEVSIDPFNVPDRVVAFANFTDISTIENATPSSTINYVETDAGLFPMSSAVYFEGDKLINSSPVTPENIYDSTIIDIYLDRIAAKVTVEMEENAKIGASIVDENAPLTMEIKNWGLTATDKSSHLLKKVSDESTNLIWAIKDDKPRSLRWAESVNYGNLSNNSDINKIALKDAKIPLASSIYAHESTRNNVDLENTDSKPSIIIVGQYKKGDTMMGTFYRLHSGNKNQIFSEDELWDKIANEQDFLFVKTSEGTCTKATIDQIKTALEFSTPTIDGKIIPAYGVTPQLKKEVKDISFCNSEGNPYIINDLNILLYNRYSILEKYFDGKCIFIVPIEHDKENQIYGLVRNHSYTLTIKNISGFGRGVASDDMIISDEEFPELPTSYTINATLTVNKWTEISQDINITETK